MVLGVGFWALTEHRLIPAQGVGVSNVVYSFVTYADATP